MDPQTGEVLSQLQDVTEEVPQNLQDLAADLPSFSLEVSNVGSPEQKLHPEDPSSASFLWEKSREKNLENRALSPESPTRKRVGKKMYRRSRSFHDLDLNTAPPSQNPPRRPSQIVIGRRPLHSSTMGESDWQAQDELRDSQDSQSLDSSPSLSAEPSVMPENEPPEDPEGHNGLNEEKELPSNSVQGQQDDYMRLLQKNMAAELDLQLRSLEACGYFSVIEEIRSNCFSTDPDYKVKIDPPKSIQDNLAVYLAKHNSTSPLHLLAAKNDINGLEALVQGKLNVNALDARRATPLHIAALYGRSEIIEILLKNGADASMTTADGCQALHYLASSAPTHLFYNVPIFISLMLDLVRAGADVNHQNRRGRSVLHELCRQENWTFCVAFLYFFPQADVNSMDMNGNTPLHMAVKANHPRLVEVLLNCGSFPDMIGNHGNARELALRLEYPEVLKVIDQPAKDTLRSQLKKVVHTLGLFYGQIETQALEKKRDEIPAKPNSGGPDQYHDTYGFALEPACEPLHKAVRQKIYKHHIQQYELWKSLLNLKQGKLVAHFMQLRNSKDRRNLRKLVHNGIPVEYRGAVWYVFSGASDRALQSSVRYSTYRNQYSKKFREQIELDLHRTFPNHNYFSYYDGLNALARVLNAYALYNRGIGYCQGMNFIAGFLLLFMPEEHAFWTLGVIVEVFLKDYFCESMLGLLIDSTILTQLLFEKTPKVALHFEKVLFPMNYLSTKFLFTMYINALPTETVMRIWDRILFDGPQVLIETAVAITQMHEQLLLAENEMVSILEYYGDIGSRIYDCEALMKELKKVSNSRLFSQNMEELRQKYFDEAVAGRHQALAVNVSEELDEPVYDGDIICQKKRKKAIPIANKLAGSDMLSRIDTEHELASLMRDLTEKRVRDSISSRPPRPPRPDNLV